VKGSDDKEDKRNLAPVPSDGVPANRVLPEASATLGDDKRVAAVYRLKMYDRARLPYAAWVAKDKGSVRHPVKTFDQKGKFLFDDAIALVNPHG
jgi:hypothetical protein